MSPFLIVASGPHAPVAAVLDDIAEGTGTAAVTLAAVGVGDAPGGEASLSTVHPRLWVTPGDIASLKARLAGSDLDEMQAFLDYMESQYASLPLGGGESEGFATLNLAFLLLTYQTGVGLTYGHTEAEWEAKFLACFDNVVAGAFYEGGQAIGVMAGYDWCFDRLSGTRRTNAVTFLKTGVSYVAAGATSAIHHFTCFYRSSYLRAGLAYAGDGIEDADAATKLAHRADLWTDPSGTGDAFNYIGNEGVGPPGIDYHNHGIWTGTGIVGWLYIDAYRTAYQNPSSGTWQAGENAMHEYCPLWFAYLVQPYTATLDGSGGYRTIYSTWQTTPSWFHPTWNRYFDIPIYLAVIRNSYATTNADMAGLAQWLGETVAGLLTTGSSGGAFTDRHAVLGRLLNYPAVTSQSPTDLDLPLSKLFTRAGHVSMRTGWAVDAGHTHVTFLAAPFLFANSTYAPTGQGHFEIHRNAPLVVQVNAGAHHEFGEHSIAKNIIIAPDTTTLPDITDTEPLGGQIRHVSYGTPYEPSVDLVAASEWDLGARRHDLYAPGGLHGYDAIYADLTSTYPAHITNCERHLVWLRGATPGTSPEHIVIYDRVTVTDTKYETRFLCALAGDEDGTKTFAVTGGSSDTVTRNSRAHPRYIDPTYVTVSYTDQGMTGKMFWTPLLPASRYLVECWGPNGSSVFYQSDSHEYEDPYGRQMAASGSVGNMDQSPLIGHGRLELLAQTTALVTPMLNVFEPVEPAGTISTYQTVSGTNTTGVRIGTTRAVIFKTTPGTLTTGTFDLEVVGTFDVLICDVPASTALTFTKGANITSITHIATSDTDLTYTSTPDRTLWLRIVVGTANTGSTNRVSW